MPRKQVLHVVRDALGGLELHGEALNGSRAGLHVEQTKTNGLERRDRFAQFPLCLFPRGFDARTRGRGARGVVVADFRQDAVHLRHLLTHRLCVLFQRLHGLGQCPEALACLFRQSLEEPVRLEADHHFSSTVLAGP